MVGRTAEISTLLANRIGFEQDWLQFIKEAINMRACIGLFKAMYAYLEAVDAESPSTPGLQSSATFLSQTTPTTPKTPSLSRSQSASNLKTKTTQDDEIDEDFRSGVYLGMGVTHLVLSLLPGRLVPILELFGYKGERKVALELLEKSGGWKRGVREPGVSREKEGLRRSLCEYLSLSD